mmetsp:Transcript_33440/g.103817  ORF Transcript_33440/g.103817 Transcript_33440/m.103817 type:complete len:285 (+) Transcript_33440:106-960(+)
MEPRPAWRKALYLRQPYEDNYVGESFLDSLVLNAHVQHYDYVTLCRGAMAVVQQLCLLCVFVGVWSRVLRRAWSHGALLALDALALTAGYACELASGRWREFNFQAALRDALCCARVAVPLWILAPLLQTLTRSWSNDTIATMTFVLLLVHVLRYDYGGARGAAALPGGAVAINAAMMAATILASRLEVPEQVFSFVAFAMEVFALLPRLSLRLRHRAPSVHALALTPVLVFLAAGLLGTTKTVAVLFVVLAAVGFLGPALLIWAQRYKAEIQGPWDIAHVEPK